MFPRFILIIPSEQFSGLTSPEKDKSGGQEMAEMGKAGLFSESGTDTVVVSL